MYVLKDFQGLGIGRELFKIALQGIIDMGFNNMYLECLMDNPTTEFYKHYNGKIIDTFDKTIEDFTIKTDIVAFKNLNNILKQIKKIPF